MGSVPIDPLLHERARRIRLACFDVDGVLTDGRLFFDSQGVELKAFSTRDGLGIKALIHFGIDVALITARSSDMVRQRAEQLGIRYLYQGQEKKLGAFEELLSASGVEVSDVSYCGDDLIDLPLLERVGLATAPADAHDWVRERVHWVAPSNGGFGAARDVCDLLLTARGLRDQVLEEFGSG